MSFAVGWDDDATNDIDFAWNAASPEDRENILSGLTSIERLLQLAPMQVGESREKPEVRVLTRSPLTIHYRVDPAARFVRVFAARVFH